MLTNILPFWLGGGQLNFQYFSGLAVILLQKGVFA